VADATHAAHAASDVSLDAAHATGATDATGANDVNASHVHGCILDLLHFAVAVRIIPRLKE